MASKATETDKEILARVMAEPTFEKVAEAMRKANKAGEQAVIDMLKSGIGEDS
ncbi:MAG: hypothetical protein AB7O39_03360 [Flavobacteriaceae bacterium]